MCWEERRPAAHRTAGWLARRSPALREDLMQEADIALWRGANVRHRCIDLLRAWNHLRIDRNGEPVHRHRVHLVPLSDDFDMPAGEEVEDTVEARETAREVHALVERLPEKERHVIEATYFAGLSQREIVARYGYSINSVKWWHKRALRRMREACS